MTRTMLQAKLHRVCLTHSNLNYEGSCGIDGLLLDASGIIECQKIEIYNINNGERFSTYAIRAAQGSGEISLNGAAVRKAMVGDLLIIAAYSQYTDAELLIWHPVIVQVDEHNRPKFQAAASASIDAGNGSMDMCALGKSHPPKKSPLAG